MAFAVHLRELMDQKGFKAVDLARATGLSEAVISDYLNSKKEPRGRQSIAIAKALDVSLDNLWETEFHPSSSKHLDVSCNEKCNELLKIFETLRSEFQDYALEQVKKLAELQTILQQTY